MYSQSSGRVQHRIHQLEHVAHPLLARRASATVTSSGVFGDARTEPQLPSAVTQAIDLTKSLTGDLPAIGLRCLEVLHDGGRAILHHSRNAAATGSAMTSS